MDEVRFNPFTLATTIKGFALMDRDGADLLKIDSMLADLQLSGVFRRAVRFREFRIDRPFLSARLLQDGRPSVADLIETEAGSTQPSDTDASLPRLMIDHLILASGGISFSDASRQPVYESRFEPLNLEVRNLNKASTVEPGRVIAAPPATVKRKKADSTRVASEIVMSAEGDSEDND